MLMKGYVLLCLIFLWVGHLVNNYIWLKLDNTFLTYDAHRHFLVSFRIFDVFRKPSFQIIDNLIQTTQLHPPLVGILTAPFCFIFGFNQDAGIMINGAIFLGILIFSIYKIGSKLMNEKTGLLAAFLITIYPVVFNQLKTYMLDLPLAALVALSIYLLLMSDNFRNFKYSLFFGVSCGLGLLVKQTFIFFIIGPLGYIIIKNFCHPILTENKNVKKIVFNFFLSFSLSLLIASPYYLKKIPIVLDKARYPFVVGAWPISVPESNMFLHALRAMLWYLWGAINWQLSFFYFLLFVVGLFLYSQVKLKEKNLLYLWILVPWVLLSRFRYTIGFNMEVTGIRYTIPLLPAVALITAVGIMQIANRKIRNFSIIATVVFGIFQLFFVSYPILQHWPSKRIEIPICLSGKIEQYKMLPESIVILNFGDWGISGRNDSSYPVDAQGYLTANDQIIKILNYSNSDKKNVTVFIIPDNTELWNLEYKAHVKNMPIRFFCDWNYFGASKNVRNKGEDAEIKRLVLVADYIIDKDGGFLGEEYRQRQVLKAKYYFYQNKNKFTFLEKVNWPDNYNILIFKRKTQPL